MSETSSNNKRIAKNTVMLYIRMLLIMVVTLYTSRVVLEVLGVEDFGIYNVVGGVVAILGFFTSSLSNAAQRYMSIGLGENDLLETEHAFRQSVTLMFLLSIVLFIIGETIGLWFVYNKLVIPAGRLQAAVWIYHFSLVSVISAINQVPLMAAIIARERMNIYAYLGLFEAFTKLAIVYILMLTNSIDSLIMYGGLMAIVSILTFLFYLFYCVHNFLECKYSFYWNRPLVKEMLHFISYNLFGCFAWSAGVQGTNIILNLFFGPTVNAARAIAVQVSTVVTHFTGNIMTAVKPQIIKSYVSGEKEYMMTLIERSTKYAFFFTSLLAIPIIIEIEFILQLWLGQVPEYTVSFTRLVLCESLFGVFTPSLWIATNATGRIKNNQVYGRLITLSILPLSYLMLRFFSDPKIPFVIAIFSNIIYWFYCLFDIRKQLSLNIKRYIIEVVKPTFILSILLTGIGIIESYLIGEDSVFRFIIIFSSLSLVGILIILIILHKNERDFLILFIIKYIHLNKNRICNR